MNNHSKDHPKPCTDPLCLEQHVPDERVAMAAALCDERGLKLTATRQRVLEVLWENGRPTGAYEVIQALESDSDRRVGPPTVYRALEFLMAEGFVSKIESRNAYVACAHPERLRQGIFFICDDCGVSIELEDPRVNAIIEEDAAQRLGFNVSRPVVEVAGTCVECQPGRG